MPGILPEYNFWPDAKYLSLDEVGLLIGTTCLAIVDQVDRIAYAELEVHKCISSVFSNNVAVVLERQKLAENSSFLIKARFTCKMHYRSPVGTNGPLCV